MEDVMLKAMLCLNHILDILGRLEGLTLPSQSDLMFVLTILLRISLAISWQLLISIFLGFGFPNPETSCRKPGIFA